MSNPKYVYKPIVAYDLYGVYIQTCPFSLTCPYSVH